MRSFFASIFRILFWTFNIDCVLTILLLASMSHNDIERFVGALGAASVVIFWAFGSVILGMLVVVSREWNAKPRLVRIGTVALLLLGLLPMLLSGPHQNQTNEQAAHMSSTKTINPPKRPNTVYQLDTPGYSGRFESLERCEEIRSARNEGGTCTAVEN